MWYEINVSLNGNHFFATHERSITDTKSLELVLKVFKESFKKEDGYEITVRKMSLCGETIIV